MRTKLFAAACFAALLSGCSSAPASLTYYVLHSPQATTEDQPEAAARVYIEQLSLPEYLKQRSLAMQTGPATVYFSPRHVWAEPLDKSLRQALTASLQRHGVAVLPVAVYSPQYPVSGLHIKIDDFIPAFDGNVLIKGQYWKEDENTRPQIHQFDFRRPMQGDGFEEAVATMRLLVDDLASAISDKAP